MPAPRAAPQPDRSRRRSRPRGARVSRRRRGRACEDGARRVDGDRRRVCHAAAPCLQQSVRRAWSRACRATRMPRGAISKTPLTAISQSGAPFELGSARLELARALALSGRPDDARIEARRAFDLLTELHAELAAERAHQFLQSLEGIEAAKVPPPAPLVDPGAHRRELEVLRLVADGFNNQIIARETVRQRAHGPSPHGEHLQQAERLFPGRCGCPGRPSQDPLTAGWPERAICRSLKNDPPMGRGMRAFRLLSASHRADIRPVLQEEHP